MRFTGEQTSTRSDVKVQFKLSKPVKQVAAMAVQSSAEGLGVAVKVAG